MAKKAPDHIDSMDDSSLDEYGVWVKAAPDEPVSEPDELVSELLEDALFVESGKEIPAIEDSFPELTNSRVGPDSGIDPDYVSIQKEQEVPEMSENDKTNAASTSDELDIENDFSLGSSDDIVIPGDDELGGLSDLLMNIDEEQDSEDTIYLEDDDLSLNLDTTGDMDLDSDLIIGGDDEGYEEDITIPGLDDLSIDETDSSLEGFEDSLAQLDEDELDIPQQESLESNLGSQVSASEKLEIHDIEDVGLDEFLPDEPSLLGVDEELSDEIVIEDSISELSVDKNNSLIPPELDLDEEIVLDDISLNEDGSGDLELSLDLDEDISFDAANFPSETGIEVMMPGAIEEEKEAVSELGASYDEPDLSDLNEDLVDDFDDVAAVTADLIGSGSNRIEPAIASTAAREVTSEITSKGSTESTTVLKSIEEELHAIRSELTDLRSELKKLRDKGLPVASSGMTEDVLQRTETIVDQLQDQAESEIINNDKSSAGGGFFDDDEDETIALTGDELDNILNSAEFTEEAGEPSNPDLDEMEDAPESGIDFESEEAIQSFEDHSSKADNIGFEDTSRPDDFPPIEEINLQEIVIDDNTNESDIEIVSEDMTVGKELIDENDLMDDSVVAAEIVEDPFGGSQQAVEQMASMDIDYALAGIEELKDSEEDIELFTGDEIDSMELEIPETISGIETSSSAEQQETVINAYSEQAPDISLDLKQEIKAVLAYMDQLLESLPEEKIEEFARSEHFDVYKKLFNELGL